MVGRILHILSFTQKEEALPDGCPVAAAGNAPPTYQFGNATWNSARLP